MLKREWLLFGILSIFAPACSHALTVKNLDHYTVAKRIENADRQFVVGLTEFKGGSQDLWYYNAVAERLMGSPYIRKVVTVPEGRTVDGIDIYVTVMPHIKYDSSGWNFLINFPGFLIFTPAWHGYDYWADLTTPVKITDAAGRELGTAKLNQTYEIRQAEFDRTFWAEISWLEYGVCALVGGIYNANTFDDDIIPDLRTQLKDNYSDAVVAEIASRLKTASTTASNAVPPSATVPAAAPVTAPAAAPAVPVSD